MRRQSWRLLLNCRAFLQKPISFSCSKVRTSSISSSFHTQSRIQVAGTRKSCNSYMSLDPIVYISPHYSYPGDAIEEERGEIEMRRIEQTRTDELREIEKNWDLCFIQVVMTLIKFSNPDDIEFQLEHTEIDADLIKNVLQAFELNPDVAKRFFNFILDQDPHSSTKEMNLNLYQLYNSMLCVFAVNGLLDEFWDLAQTMNTKRYLTSFSSGKEQRYLIDITAYEKVSWVFQKQGLVSELDKFNMLFVIQCIDNSMLKIAMLLNRLNCHPSPNFRKLGDIISVTLSRDFVKLILEQECVDLKKTLMFFRWIDGSYLYKQYHDESTLRFIASVLSKEDDDYLEKHGKVFHEIKREGDIERGGIVGKVLRFYYNELARPNTTPSVNCCIYLLMKLALSDCCPSHDMGRDVYGVVVAFQKYGGILTDSMVGDVINMLISLNKTGDLNLIADLVICDEYLSNIQYRPRGNIDIYSKPDYRGIDREERARLIFSRIQEETSSCTI